MRNWIKALAVTSAVATGLAAAPALYAHESDGSGESMMGAGMMGMMQQMSGTVEGCSNMMQLADAGAAKRPNEQWRKDAPRDGTTPDNND
ncbi:MAG: hypothetical protein GEU89_11815 [Kiloniellaceae bacterium]|nr:hypothetical protein [Kiloniellaceae bacterium]